MVFDGIRRKIIARMQNRIGPPIIQPIYDFFKLMGKENLTAKESNNIFFRISPYIYALLTFGVFFLLPLNLIAFEFDYLLLVYLFIASSFFIIVGGVASRNPFAILGSLREMILMIFYELAFLIAVVTFFFYANVTTVGAYSMFGLPALPIASLVLFGVAFIELRVTPFEIPEASSEIIAGAEIEYTGPRLAFFKLAGEMKALGFLMLTVFLTLGVTGILELLGLSLLLLLVLSFCQATTPRYRIDQGVRWYILFFILSLIELIRVVYFVSA